MDDFKTTSTPDPDDFEILPPLRKPDDGSQEMAELVINGIDSNVARLAEHGLRPHPVVTERRPKLMLILEAHRNAT